MLKVRSFILAALVATATNSAHACNENCRAIFMDPLSRETPEGIDEACVMRREACHSCAREKPKAPALPWNVQTVLLTQLLQIRQHP
jgi:hypothetical protein